jgi:UDP-N-acetylmuramoyl-tripeptide--D-alanyl-D-alanine ligase
VRWTTTDIARATGGRVHGEDLEVSRLAIDSRRIVGGELFVALKAERDGHEWIGDALRAGAAAYLAERPVDGGTGVVVADTGAALRDLGRAARARLDPVVVGITGSVGKTTTKDMARAVLGTTFVTHATERSLNNEIGVPITLFEAPVDAGALVVELGARSVGDIRALCEIVVPAIGVVTRVAPVHTEVFGDIDGVERAKRELVEALPPSGTAILNADDPRVARMAGWTPARVVTFGAAGDVRAEIIDVDDALRALVRLVVPTGSVEVRLSARGVHQAANAAAAAAVGVVCGVDVARIAEGLADAPLSPMRMSLAISKRGVQVLDDSYNANPASVEAALASLAQIPAARRVAVLGRMAELGDVEAAEHRRIADVARSLGIDLVAVDTPLYGVESLTEGEALHSIEGLGPGDAILVKASRVAGLDRLAEQIRESR